MKKIYLVGPWSGLPKLNKEAFDDLKKRLTEFGHSVVSPFDLFEGTDVSAMSRTEYMRIRIKALMECNGFLLMEGYEKSTDATTERMVASNIGLQQYRLQELVKQQPHATTTVLDESRSDAASNG